MKSSAEIFVPFVLLGPEVDSEWEFGAAERGRKTRVLSRVLGLETEGLEQILRMEVDRV